MPHLTHRLRVFLASPRGKRILNSFYAWAAALVILGVLFKLLHIRYADQLILVSMLTEVAVFFISGFEKPEQTYDWEKVFPELNPKPGRDSLPLQEQLAGIRELLAQQVSPQAPSPSAPASHASANELLHLAEAIAHLEEAITQLSQTNRLSSQIHSSLTPLKDDGDTAHAQTAYQEELQRMERHVTSINTLYELQLKGISTQIETIDRINAGLSHWVSLYERHDGSHPSIRRENERLLQHLQQLNEIYARMLQALQLQVPSAPSSTAQ